MLDDPGRAYTSEVQTALIDAMLDFGPPIPVADGEWLTIAARDNDDSRLGGGDPYDVVHHPPPDSRRRPGRVPRQADHARGRA